MIKKVLFACNMNSVRSPMAEAIARNMLGDRWIVESCGVYEGVLDPFVARVLEESDVSVPTKEPQTFGRVDLSTFDHVIALTPEAAAEARKLGVDPEFWEIQNPTDIRGDEEALMEAYRTAREQLRAKIADYFS